MAGFAPTRATRAAGDPVRQRQLVAVQRRLGSAQAQAAAALVETMTALPAELRLPLIELSIPQLVAHPPAHREALIGCSTSSP